jgi:hypothetical protein
LQLVFVSIHTVAVELLPLEEVERAQVDGRVEGLAAGGGVKGGGGGHGHDAVEAR